MTYIADNGQELTDEMLNAMAEEYENGTWEGVGKASRGRPRLYDEDMETVSLRLPKSRVAAINAVSKRRGVSKSDFIRSAIDKALLSEA